MTIDPAKHAIPGCKRAARAAAPSWRGALALLAVGSLLLAVPGARAATEYEVKAAFLYNFAKFVEWPTPAFSAADSPVVLGVIGEDPFGGTLPAVVEHEQVKGRRIEVRPYHIGDDLAGCHALFISKSESGHLKESLKAAQAHNILTAGASSNFLAQGGIINFAMVDKRARFDINVMAAEPSAL